MGHGIKVQGNVTLPGLITLGQGSCLHYRLPGDLFSLRATENIHRGDMDSQTCLGRMAEHSMCRCCLSARPVRTALGAPAAVLLFRLQSPHPTFAKYIPLPTNTPTTKDSQDSSQSIPQAEYACRSLVVPMVSNEVTYP